MTAYDDSIYELNMYKIKPAQFYDFPYSRVIRESMKPNWMNDFGVPPTYEQKSNIESTLVGGPLLYKSTEGSLISFNIKPKSKNVIRVDKEVRSKTYLSGLDLIGGAWGLIAALYAFLFEEDKYDKTRKNVYHYRTGPCTVALKKLKGEMEFTQTFLLEVQAQFDFCHLYGITQDPSTLEYMFIMRFAPQGDLRRYLLRNFDNLTLPNKLGIAQTICAELEKIHAKGWVHGDLHSGNILLLNEENAFISDFGMRSRDDFGYPNSEYLIEISGDFFKDYQSGFFDPDYDLIKYSDSEIHQQLKIAHKACRIYIKMKWKPNKPIHSEAVYTSRSFSYKSLQDEIDILLVKSNRSSIVG
ncbi:21663_t:CDS:2 [Rhizophagus irregularis]|nr:21663_t:CDS:2 [Rhizophagus irregularis]